MTDNLRDRIATALRNLTGDLTYEAIADAVIRELGLKRASRPSNYGHVNYPPGYQYITDWIADE